MPTSRLVLLALAPVTLALILACAGGSSSDLSAGDGASGDGPATTVWTSSGASFKKWSIPSDVSNRLIGDGWSPVQDECSADEEGDLYCYASKGEQVARVVWFDYEGGFNAMTSWKDELQHGEVGERDGPVVLSIRVADNPASIAALKAFLPERVDLGTVDQAAMRKRLESAGYTGVSCEEDDELTDQCSGSKGDDHARLTVGREPDPENAPWEIDADSETGGAFLWDPTGWAKATVFKGADGKALMGVMLKE